MSGSLRPLGIVAENDHGPLVTVYATIASCVSVFTIALRLLISFRRELQFQSDDFSVLVALGASIAQSATWGLAVKYGLGRHISTLSEESLSNYYKIAYISLIVGILAMSFSKLSFALLLKRLSIYHSILLDSSIPLAGTSIWAIFSLFATLFQCNLPNPWQLSPPSRCQAREGLLTAIIILNIVTDAILSVYAVPGIWRLNMAKNVRLTVLALFTSRVIVCAVAVLQLVYLVQNAPTQDETWDNLNFVIVTNITVHLSLITATIPRLHNFIASLPTGRSSAHVQASKTHPITALRTYILDKAHDSSAVTRSTSGRVISRSSSTGTDRHSLRLVPNSPVELSTRIYSSHSGNTEESNLDASSASSKVWNQNGGQNKGTGDWNDNGAAVGSVNLSHEVTVAVEYHAQESVNHISSGGGV